MKVVLQHNRVQTPKKMELMVKSVCGYTIFYQTDNSVLSFWQRSVVYFDTGTSSSEAQVRSVVLQGSMLGPLQFLTYNRTYIFSSSFLLSPKCPTVSPQQEATSSSTSYLILRLKEFTKVVESSIRPWRRPSCFETTPSIQVIGPYNYDKVVHVTQK